jgi:hypothetical protein
MRPPFSSSDCYLLRVFFFIYFFFIFHLAYSSTLKMKATCSSKTSADFNASNGLHGFKSQETELLKRLKPFNLSSTLLLLLLLLLLLVGWDWVPRYLSPWYYGHFGLLYEPQMIDEDGFWSNWRNKIWQGKPKYSEKTYPSATLFTTKSYMTDPVSNPGPQWWEASD